MKWKNKGHEFDDQAKKIHQIIGGKKIYVFGAGYTAERYVGVFKHFGLIEGFIDNSQEKQKGIYFGKNVISLEEWLQRDREKTFIVVCVNEVNYESIKSQLLENGLRENFDFFRHDVFYECIMPVFLVYDMDSVFLPLVQISLTERCTLKCKKCAHACHLVSPNKSDLSLEEAIYSGDKLFSAVGFVRDFVLIGGEPLLYKDLKDVIGYIGEKYRDRIDIFSITTNGTIIPGDDVLNQCKKYNVLFRISNYAKTLPWLNEKHERLINKLKSYGIRFSLSPKDATWIDYGFEYYDRHGTPEELSVAFDQCNTPCHEIRGSKFYFCVMARSVSENMNRKVGEEDYFDFELLRPEFDKKKLFEYFMGYSDKGYLEMCNYCHGAQASNFPIPVAEQMK